ncbi:hypothetical protein SAMN05660226_02792 [Parapedobacter luteus]|uniref:Agl cluster protein AglQ n=1 Tax=Parapedobacter luteus TaxID=623280 RepID=A0A1T5DGN5_9SPHI|nr:hypothetical protein [Parapedobacter luteus]SKB70633.1 hypothetical protein SAMN05660226_02792 [Parapedobacter luteus]
MTRQTLKETIYTSAQRALVQIRKDGSLPPGHNGPYFDNETPVRNTGHWLMVFLKAYEHSGESRFKEAAAQCLNFLLSEKSRPHNATFWHRMNPKKDFTNGLIGQAWTIEALVYAYTVFKDERILEVAKEVFNLHPYDNELKGWKTVNIDGAVSRFDYTFNHQLWFCAAGALLLKEGSDKASESVMDFIKNIPNAVKLYNSGVIRHIPPFFLKKGLIMKLRAFVSEMRRNIKEYSYIYQKSIGYHGFNLYAIALIDNTLKDSNLLRTNSIKKAIRATEKNTFRKLTLSSKYAYPYNPIGFELAYTYYVLGDIEKTDYWLTQQYQQTFDTNSGMFDGGKTFDKLTAAARIYEAIRLV